ncbi:MAG: SRPBCC domain-containing protein [Candidatus Korobacteraceae bacterium]|jgi:carbon monoxide dehydrogenase subunit G
MTHCGTFLTNRNAEEVFDLLANPERFAPLLPDFESMSTEDEVHFTVRIVIAIGEISGHANLAMELGQALRPSAVEYTGAAMIAGSPLKLRLRFQIASSDGITKVTWQGEFSLEGMLSLMAGGLIDSMGRQNFELMAEHIQNALRDEVSSGEAFTSPAS